MRILFFLFIIFSSFTLAQIKVNFMLAFDKKSAIIEIQNTSLENYALPLEMTNIKEFIQYDTCEDFPTYGERMHLLSFNLKVFGKDNKVLEPRTSLPSLDNVAIDEWILNNKNCLGISDNDVVNNKIPKSQNEIAKINSYVFNNIILLNPGEKIKFRVLFDLHNISNDIYPQRYYNLNNVDKYSYQLVLEILNCHYNYLTEEQKFKIKDYKLFIGKLESILLAVPTIMVKFDTAANIVLAKCGEKCKIEKQIFYSAHAFQFCNFL